MSKRNSKTKPQKLSRLLFYVGLILVVSWILFWGRNSYLNTWRLERRLKSVQQEMQALQVQNDSLAMENHRLKTDPKAAEQFAREKFGLVKPGEKVFQFTNTANGKEGD